jgi:hypothetical protein
LAARARPRPAGSGAVRDRRAMLAASFGVVAQDAGIGTAVGAAALVNSR